MITIDCDMQDVRAALAARPGSVLLLAGPGADRLAADLAVTWGGDVVSVGRRTADIAAAGVPIDAPRLLSEGAVFADLDVLFWEPALHVEVLTLLRQVAKRRQAAFVWPGSITNAVARYSESGRADFYESILKDVLVIKARSEAYSGETPYTMELVGA